TNLRQVRKQLADFWLFALESQLESIYLSEIGKAYRLLLDSGIRNASLTNTEQDFVNEIVAHIPKGYYDSKNVQYLLAAMLYCRTDQLSLQHDLQCIPNYLLNDYLKFILDAPDYFQEIGEADNYYQYTKELINYLYANIINESQLKLWQDVASIFTQTNNLIPLYFNNKNLSELYAKRASIMEFTLRTQGHQIDYEFPERTEKRKKIRLGILAAHFGPQTETYTTLPLYKDLDWNIFEVFLYSVHISNHRLERYCAGHADAFIPLPQDLASQVQIIRNGDLDIILIGTNVTAVTNATTLLALHRLARIQVTSVSSPVTTGMRNIEYYISGNLTEPLQDAQKQYCEQLVILDGPAQCFNYILEPEISGIKTDRKSLDIPDDCVVFISGANFYKILPELREAWAKIIAAIPESVLVLYPFSPSWSNSYEATYFLNSMNAIFARYSIEKKRLVVLDTLPSRSDVRKCLDIGNVYLDSYPYSGANSTVDPLEVGLPTVVMDGDSLRSRQAAALLRELQMPDLIATSEESYIRIAIALGTDPELRQQKSEQIKQRMQANPRFLDSRSYSAQMGALFQRLFQKYQARALTDSLKLRDHNIIIFPDWGQSENRLYQNLASLITNLVNHPDKNKITLLINTANISEDDASLFLSDVVMNLLLEEDLDITDGPEISLVGETNESQWKALLPCISAQIVLENENKQESMEIGADKIRLYRVEDLNNERFI
ncbi:MAG: hypothetical protein H0X31_12680, partial [Nostocaceae cyanobacterium]|nr:hypothetical protein [Nostocaceae cyanobacterium]